MMGNEMKINKKLLPIKGHYFLFNAGTAPLVPYMSTYARQLGFSSATVGLIYTVLPIFGLIAKPLFGLIADRYHIQKIIFIIFQIVTIVTFSAIYLLLDTKETLNVELDCLNNSTVLRSCFQTAEHVDKCKVNTLRNDNGTASCNMYCDMTSPKMWQTVCEDWNLPQYCNYSTERIEYTSYLRSVSIKDDDCAYMSTNKIALGGQSYSSKCRMGDGYVNINEPCTLNCSDQNISAMWDEKAIMICLDGYINYRYCANDTSQLVPWANLSDNKCKTTCDLNSTTPWRLMEMCKGWKASDTDSCNMKSNMKLPSNLTITSTVALSPTFSKEECVFMNLMYVELSDGSIHHPSCYSKTQYQIDDYLFYASCEISCNNTVVNELIRSASDSKETTQYTKQFWIFFILMIINWVGQAVVVTFADAICFYLLGDDLSLYGKQRLWGSVGWGIFSLLTGVLIDLFSEGQYKNYSVAFLLMLIFMMGDVAVSCLIKIRSLNLTINIVKDVTGILKSMPVFIYILWTIAVGLCTGLIWQFLFWHIEDISCDNSDYIKTLQGLVSAIQTFCGEIPFMFISGYVIEKLGHVNMMSLVLFAFGVRFILYSFLTYPWWVLPIEMLQGITFGMFYPTMTSYANSISPPGTETTIQGLVGAIFEGVGTSLGSFIGGRLYEKYGGWNTFRWFGYGALICCAIHIIIQCVLQNKPEDLRLKRRKYTVDDN